MSDVHFTFGKHTGLSVSACPDVRYLAWLCTQNWPRTKYPYVYRAARDELIRRLSAEARSELANDLN